jgi:predicted amidophosphoribosyltransferase
MLTRHLATRLDAVVFGRAYSSLSSALAAFGALALPSACVVCGRWDTSLCSRCSGAFRRATARPFRAEDAAESLPDVELAPPARRKPADRPPVRDGGTTPMAGRGRDARPDDGPPYRPLPVVSAGRYGREVSAVMLAYKNHGHVDLTVPLAAALAGSLHQALSGGAIGAVPGRPVLLVPVPSRAAARRRRGYDPLMLLLTQLDRGGKLPAGARLAPWLGQVHPVVRVAVALRDGRSAVVGRTALGALTAGMFGGQKGADRRRRRTNVLYSMALRGHRVKDVAGRTCIIVDDVLTTGATIGEAHRALSSAGAVVLGAVVVAATRSPSGYGVERGPAGAAAPRPPSAEHRRPSKVAERQGMNKGGR